MWFSPEGGWYPMEVWSRLEQGFKLQWDDGDRAAIMLTCIGYMYIYIHTCMYKHAYIYTHTGTHTHNTKAYWLLKWTLQFIKKNIYIICNLTTQRHNTASVSLLVVFSSHPNSSHIHPHSQQEWLIVIVTTMVFKGRQHWVEESALVYVTGGKLLNVSKISPTTWGRWYKHHLQCLENRRDNTMILTFHCSLQLPKTLEQSWCRCPMPPPLPQRAWLNWAALALFVCSFLTVSPGDCGTAGTETLCNNEGNAPGT